ncbi:HD domain-containing protein [Micromonospora sp. NPDC004540]|uniref:HD domain-containing protein n=1 Tax=Micromonospora sp. NPDC004540 TaxID=3154457 RepID=UPI0033AB971D
MDAVCTKPKDACGKAFSGRYLFRTRNKVGTGYRKAARWQPAGKDPVGPHESRSHSAEGARLGSRARWCGSRRWSYARLVQIDAQLAAEVAEEHLAVALPRRWRHVRAVGAKSRRMERLVRPEERDLLVAAAWLHDIGYAPAIVDTGFHALDGARWLMRQGFTPRLAGLVANHSCASYEAAERGLAEDLAAEFPLEESIRPPKYQAPKVVPWPNDLRARFRAAVTDRYRVTVDLGAGCGLRQGEIFGVSPDDVDPARPVLHVTRQVKLVRGRLIFAPPKGGKVRDVPLPESVSRRLTEHAKQYPPVTSPSLGAPRPASRGRCRST